MAQRRYVSLREIAESPASPGLLFRSVLILTFVDRRIIGATP